MPRLGTVEPPVLAAWRPLREDRFNESRIPNPESRL